MPCRWKVSVYTTNNLDIQTQLSNWALFMLPSSAALDLLLCSATWALYRALLVVLVVVAAFSSLVRIWGDFVHVCARVCVWTIHSLRALSSFFKWRSAHTHRFHFPRPRSDQWLCKPRRLWMSFSWWAVCDHVFPERTPHFAWTA